MTDTIRLDGVIRGSGLKYAYLAEQLGVSRQTFYLKRTGKNEFTGSEIVKLQHLMNLPNKLRDEIFLV